MRLLHCVFLALAVSCCVPAQTYTVSTFAGGGLPVNIPGASAFLRGVDWVAVDGAGNVFFTTEYLVLRLDAVTGILSPVAGNGTQGFSGDNGPATSAQLSPTGVAVDSAGNLYIADRNRIRKVSGGVITTVAGNGTQGFSGDNGPATSAQLSEPYGVAVDFAGNLYIADRGNHRIRKVSGGVITTVAGNGLRGFSGDDGPATSAQLNSPSGIAVDSAGNLYISDHGNNRIRKVSGGVISTVAGNGTQGFSGDDGPAISAQLNGPIGVAVDSAGNLYMADSLFNFLAEPVIGRIRKVSGGVISTIAELSGATGVAVDSAGNLYIADTDSLLRKLSGGVITTVAGGGSPSADDGPATSAQLYEPSEVAVDSADNLYIADTSKRIRKVSGGVITTVAGGGSSLDDNGPATSAQLRSAAGVAVDSVGNIYIADWGRIRKVSGGVITTVAGNGTQGFSGDNGPATSAQLSPTGVAVDSAGNLYIADSNRIRKVSGGVITTVAGNGTSGFSGDNGPATSAQLSAADIAVDSAGNLYIADTRNRRIRKVSGGVITTVAGNGTEGSSGDNGPASSAQLKLPFGVAVDSAGNLYIADVFNPGIRKVSDGVIATVAGNGTYGFSGDNGPATSAQLSQPTGVAVDSAGNVYVADSANNRVRLLQPQPLSITGVTNRRSDR